MKTCLKIDPRDNVATLLADAVIEELRVIGGFGDEIIACCEPIKLGHKIACVNIDENDAVLKYGVQIGIAKKAIKAGEWVHLHNCRSQLDQRSGSFDVQSGMSKDVSYE